MTNSECCQLQIASLGLDVMILFMLYFGRFILSVLMCMFSFAQINKLLDFYYIIVLDV